MTTLRDLPIRQKLLAITMVTLLASLIPAGIGIVLVDSILFRAQMLRDATALANVIGDTSTAALAFDDPRVATETLAALKERPHTVAACIYTPDGQAFARYARPGPGNLCQPPARSRPPNSAARG